MRSNNNSSSSMRRGETHCMPLEPVGISSDLIAFYPQAINQPQPYVILLDQVSGRLRRVDLQSAK